MRAFAIAIVIAGLTLQVLAQQAPPPSVNLDQGRPPTPGITRTTLKEDAKSTVTRVRFAPGSLEPPHTHPYDVILVPVLSSPVDAAIGETKLTSLKPGEVQFVPKGVVPHVGNTGTPPFELIAIALK
jgi:quercetin dioxygenase-like cupin family protein